MGDAHAVRDAFDGKVGAIEREVFAAAQDGNEAIRPEVFPTAPPHWKCPRGPQSENRPELEGMKVLCGA